MKDNHESLNNYLYGLSQPPRVRSSPDQIKKSDAETVDFSLTNKESQIVTSSKSLQGVCLQKLSLEEQDSSNLVGNDFKEDILKKTNVAVVDLTIDKQNVKIPELPRIDQTPVQVLRTGWRGAAALG